MNFITFLKTKVVFCVMISFFFVQHMQGMKKNYLASGSSDGTIKIWDSSTGQCKQIFDIRERQNIRSDVLNYDDMIFSIACSPDGLYIVSTGPKTIKILDIKTGQCKCVIKEHNNSIYSGIFSFDGKFIVTGSKDRTIRVWDVKTGKCKQIIETSGCVYSVAFSPDGTSIVASENGIISIWDFKTGKCRQIIETQGCVSSVAFSPDNHLIASGSSDNGDYIVRIWDFKTGKCKQILKGHENFVASMSFTLDGQYITSGSWDKTIRIWDVKNGKCKQIIETPGYVHSVALSPDGTSIVSGENGIIRIWDFKTSKCKQIIEAHRDVVVAIVFMPPQKDLDKLERIVYLNENFTSNNKGYFPDIKKIKINNLTEKKVINIPPIFMSKTILGKRKRSEIEDIDNDDEILRKQEERRKRRKKK